jgi:hypothetical protein
MTNHPPKLTDQAVLQHARPHLRDHLPLHADGSVCTTDDLLQVVLGVAVTQATIEALCADLVGTPAPETLRRYLNAHLRVDDLPALEAHGTAALVDALPAQLWARPRAVAIVFHDRPDDGTTAHADGVWVRGDAHAGTTRFDRVATASLMRHGLRLTLAIRFVLPEDDTLTVLDHLLGRVDTLGVQANRLFLEKGVAGTAVLADLTERRHPAVRACPMRGKSGGTRALGRGHRRYRTTHTVTARDKTRLTAEVAVWRTLTTARRTQRMGRRAPWLIVILIHLDLPPKRVRRLSRRRFGVESSSRCAGQVRGWTPSRNAAYRCVLIGLSFLLLTGWLVLRWHVTQGPRRGRRWLDTHRFAVSRFVTLLRRALEHHYRVVHEIVAPAVPRL